MNYLFISPQFPDNFKHFVERLKANGVTVFGLGSDSYDSLSDSLKHNLSYYHQVSNLEDLNEVIPAIQSLIDRFGSMDRLESHNEYWLEQDAILRSWFNIWGLKQPEMDRIKKKSEMKNVFRSLGLTCTDGEVFTSYDEALALIKNYGYPVVVKPDKGVGAAFTYRLDNEDDLNHFFSTKPDKVFILEPFDDYPMVTYDGLTDTQGNILFENTMEYDSGVMDNVVLDKDMYYFTKRTIEPELKKWGRKVVKAYGLKERFFHMEFFRTDDGHFKALEINVRPPGGMTMDMFNYANDYDFFEAYANVVTQQTPDIPSKKPYYLMYVGVKETNRNKRVLSHDEVIQQFGPSLVYHGPIASIFSPAIGSYTYMLRSALEAPVVKAAKAIIETKKETL